MEISYTKQQQKQKQKQKAKSQDNDMMDVFDKRHQLRISDKSGNYYQDSVESKKDTMKSMLSLPVSVPIYTAQYNFGGETKVIRVYPTVQFMYSHHIMPQYITDDVRAVLGKAIDEPQQYCSSFVDSVTKGKEEGMEQGSRHPWECLTSCIRQNPQFSLVGIQPGVYIIGMKDQFNIHDRETHPLSGALQYAIDELGFVLFDKTNTKSVDDFGPYFIEQYVLLDLLSKQEVAQNVITYYRNHKDKLESCLEKYDEKQGKGFICWRFLINQAALSSSDT